MQNIQYSCDLCKTDIPTFNKTSYIRFEIHDRGQKPNPHTYFLHETCYSCKEKLKYIVLQTIKNLMGL